MIAMWAALFCASLVVLLSLLLRRAMRLLRSARVHYAALVQERETAKAIFEPLLWARWWARNAAETAAGNAPAVDREALQRLALAALCADGVETLRQALQREALQVGLLDSEVTVSSDQQIPGVFRSALQELCSPEKAWEAWARNFPGKPAHAPMMVQAGLQRALSGSFVTWEGQANSGLVTPPPEKLQ